MNYRKFEVWIMVGVFVMFPVCLAKIQHEYAQYLQEYQKKVWTCHNKGMKYNATRGWCEKTTVLVPDKVTQMEFEYFE